MFTYEEKKSLEKTVLALKLLKQLSMQNILDPQKENVILIEDVNRALECASTARREKLAA